MKEDLIKIYQKRLDQFDEIAEKFKQVNLHGPFLLSPNTKYQKSKKRLLIIGQETKGWHRIQDNIDGLMKVYEDFDLGRNYYSSPFWNVIRKVERVLDIEKYGCAWTNLNKYDVNKKRPKGIYEDEICKFDDLLIDEIEILKPDICIFFTGPDFDTRLKRTFKNLVFQEEKNWKPKQLSILKNEKLPTFSIRAYHPNYLRLKKYENSFIEFLEEKKRHIALNRKQVT